MGLNFISMLNTRINQLQRELSEARAEIARLKLELAELHAGYAESIEARWHNDIKSARSERGLILGPLRAQ